ncbi:MAG: CoB--CoM heterodisulfide reductase iron-sulfur subunit B family protein [Candidatus Schekmanbacteria bacterium]|nr:CoB--CoM heterodisulfide reductase iron-sulfur subunit B family protein [Candidatus Schekmanbacteria bacterium]
MSVQAYFPGCSLESSSREFDKSTHLVCKALDIDLKELPDWSCCGAHAAHHTRHNLSTILSARNLSIATKEGYDSIMAPCPACYNRLKSAQIELAECDKKQAAAREDFNFQINPDLRVFSILEFLAGIDKAVLQAKVKKNLKELKVAAYYGCLLVRPPKLVNFDDPESPVTMDEILTAVGATVVPWDYKVQCCGASLSVSDPDIQAKLCADILEMAKLAGAQAIVVACPLCHANLDLKQGQINRRMSTHYDIPIFYLTQIIGLAWGFSPQELEIDKHMVDSMSLLTAVLK